MKRALPIAVFVLALAVTMPLQAMEPVTVTGEVIDSLCYVKMGAKGEGHRECAQTCADAGIPLALLEDGTDQVIWLGSAQDMTTPNADLRPHASHKVRITGEYAERGGVKILLISEIEHLSAGS